MRILAALTLATLVATSAAADCQADVSALRALYDIRQELMRGAGTSSYAVTQTLDASLERLRDPLPGGGYRWVHWVRPGGDPPVSKYEHLVNAGFDSGSFDEFEATGNHPFGVRVTVPRKRSIRKANSEVYVGRVSIKYWVDGRLKTMERDIHAWLPPDTMKTFDLGVVADRAEVTIEAAARQSAKREALVEIHFKEAVAEDNPENPGYDAIQSLTRLRGDVTPVKLDYEIAKFERRLFPELTSTPYTTLMLKLRDAEKLIRSEKTEDQEKGKKMLTEVAREAL